MESLLVVVLCVCLAGQVLGLPQSVDTVLSTKNSAEQSSGNEPGVLKEPQGSQPLKRSPAEDGASDVASPKLLKDSPFEKEQDLDKKELGDSSKLSLNRPEADEQNVRKKKSTTMQDIPHTHGPHTTTVCIQVRSDHQPKVVCGDPLNDAKKEGDQSMIPPGKARVAFRTPNDYYPHTYEQTMYMPAPGVYRTSQPDIPEMIPGRPSPANLGPTKPILMNQGSMSPKAAGRGSLPVSMYPLKRSEEEAGAKMGDGTLPQGPSTRPIYIQKQYYPPYLSNMIPGPPSSLRLNCAPEGGFAYLRSGQPSGYMPYEERVIVNPMAARKAETLEYIDNQQGYFIDPEARQDISDNIVGSPYLPDGLSGTLFVDEDGQAYIMHNTQGRSAQSDQFLGDEIKEDLAEKTRRQEKELERSNQKLEDLTKQIKTIQRKVAEGVEKKEDKKDMPDMKQDNPSELTTDLPEKKLDPTKNAKRNVYRREHVMRR